jgi:spore coat protein A
VPFTAQLDPLGHPIPATMTYTLLVAPAERADFIIDFTNVPIGSKLILYNDAPAPFPEGDPRNDYYTGAPDYTPVGGAPTPVQKFGPNTRTLMQFRVKARVGKADPPQMAALETIAVPVVPNLVKPSGLPRRLALYENFDAHGRLQQMLGTLAGPTAYPATPGEVVNAFGTEVWEIYNTTGDTHPMHFHLVNVRILGRAPFVPDANGMPTFDAAGKPLLAGPLRGPDLMPLT